MSATETDAARDAPEDEAPPTDATPAVVLDRVMVYPAGGGEGVLITLDELKAALRDL